MRRQLQWAPLQWKDFPKLLQPWVKCSCRTVGAGEICWKSWNWNWMCWKSWNWKWAQWASKISRSKSSVVHNEKGFLKWNEMTPKATNEYVNELIWHASWYAERKITWKLTSMRPYAMSCIALRKFPLWKASHTAMSIGFCGDDGSTQRGWHGETHMVRRWCLYVTATKWYHYATSATENGWICLLATGCPLHISAPLCLVWLPAGNADAADAVNDDAAAADDGGTLASSERHAVVFWDA